MALGLSRGAMSFVSSTFAALPRPLGVAAFFFPFAPLGDSSTKSPDITSAVSVTMASGSTSAGATPSITSAPTSSFTGVAIPQSFL